jgi:hypothetical protein
LGGVKVVKVFVKVSVGVAGEVREGFVKVWHGVGRVKGA